VRKILDKKKFISESLTESSETKLKIIDECSEDIISASELIIDAIMMLRS